MISLFKDDYAFLSNFYPCDIEYEGITYPSVEAAFQAQKTEDVGIQMTFAETADPAKAKHLGRKVPLRDDWEIKKDHIMYVLLKIKFSDPILKQKLLNTGNELLIEGNTWHDNYWGVCTCSKCIRKEHTNMLGRLLMKVRAEVWEV